jgi:hypothetical protein
MVLSIEEYIIRREKEDKLDQFDTNQRADNLKICVNYVFEYFNNYLNITEADEKTALKEDKLASTVMKMVTGRTIWRKYFRA